MEKYCILVFIICISTQIKAQEWTKKDSVWLKRVLAGEEKLHLNDEAKRAIESGTLLSPDPNIQEQMRMNPVELPIIKSFEGITAPEKKYNPHELPPPVYKLYGLDAKDSLPDATRSTTFYGQDVLKLVTLDAITPRKATVDDKTALRPNWGSVNADDILGRTFRPGYRAKQRNKKNANAYKTYNSGY